MSLEKVPFRNYTVGEKDSPFNKGKILNIRLNPQEYKDLMIMAKSLNISREGTLLKKLALIGQNVIIRDFGLDLLKFFLDDKRLVNESKLDGIIVKEKEK